MRVGEAKKPGPRTAKVRSRSVPLEKTLSTNMTVQYARGFKSLTVYLAENDLPSAERLAECHARTLNEALMRWARFRYENDISKDLARMGLLSFGEKFWWCRMLLKPTWGLIEEWEAREPSEHRRPIPPLVVRALIAVALAWRWYRVAAVLWMSFHAMLRPGEANDLLCEDMCFLEVDEDGGGVFVIVIREPKASRKYATVQHVIADEPQLVAFPKWLLEGRRPSEPFYGVGAGTFAKRLETLLAALRLAGEYTPAPAGQRGSGCVGGISTISDPGADGAQAERLNTMCKNVLLS